MPDPFAALRKHPAAGDALRYLQTTHDATTEIQVEIAEISAPVGQEAARADAVAHWLRAAGCTVTRDAAGNVIARRVGRRGGPAVILSAHLDTVFPAAQPLAVARPGDGHPTAPGVTVPDGEWHGPGIADDAAGLAGLIAIAQACAATGLHTERDLIFLATVGEEAHGNLRGIRHFLQDHRPATVHAFLTLDHPAPEEIVHRGVGSRRFAITFHGPGGHGWGDFGRHNPAYALGDALARLGAWRPPGAAATFNVGQVAAGHSVNAIPETARLDIDLRSEDPDALLALEHTLRDAVAAGLAAEQARRPDPASGVTIELIGERPAGQTPADAPLVQTAAAALKAEGFATRLAASSTDANAMMAAGIPAIGLGWGGRSGNLHSVREFHAPAGRDHLLRAVLRVLLSEAGVAD